MQKIQHGRQRGFLSFDYDNDRNLKALLVGQTRNKSTNFVLADYSLKEAQPSRTWESAARKRRAMSNLVIVLVGSGTHRAPGVLKEVKMAREEGIPIVQIRQSGTNHRRVKGAGVLYSWTWPNLEKLLNRTFKRSPLVLKSPKSGNSIFRRSRPLRGRSFR